MSTPLERAKAVPIESEIARRGIRLKRVGAEYYGQCPRCGGTDRFAINIRKQLFLCRQCAPKAPEAGDVVALVMFLDGSNYPDAVETLTGERPRAAAGRPARESFERKAPEAPQPQETSQRAGLIWREAVQIEGTLAGQYLRSARGIELPAGMGDVLRFHPACPFGPGARHPCMVALFTGITSNIPTAIHRTAITPDARKLCRPMALGPISGAAIKLDPDESVTSGVVIGEGVETCLSALLAGLRPVWCVGSAGGISTFPVLAGIEAITILGEIDDHDANAKAVRACADRWIEAGQEAFLVAPLVGDDFNTAWKAAS